MSKRSDFNQLSTALRRLNLEQAKQLYAELGAIVQALERESELLEAIAPKGREVMDVHHVGNHIYQYERVRCGKAGCKCAGQNGELHGPYWYAYWRDDGKLRSRYVGKQLRYLE
jgi:hypothetical protein